MKIPFWYFLRIQQNGRSIFSKIVNWKSDITMLHYMWRKEGTDRCTSKKTSFKSDFEATQITVVHGDNSVISVVGDYI